MLDNVIGEWLYKVFYDIIKLMGKYLAAVTMIGFLLMFGYSNAYSCVKSETNFLDSVINPVRFHLTTNHFVINEEYVIKAKKAENSKVHLSLVDYYLLENKFTKKAVIIKSDPKNHCDDKEHFIPSDLNSTLLAYHSGVEYSGFNGTQKLSNEVYDVYKGRLWYLSNLFYLIRILLLVSILIYISAAVFIKIYKTLLIR